MGLAIASLVLGILAFLGSVLVVGGLLGLAGLILGAMHLTRRQGRNGMAWAGIGLSAASVVVAIGIGVVVGRFVTSPEFKQQFKQAMQAATGGNLEAWVGVPAPDISVTTLSGDAIKLSELKGKRVVLDFWATWCPPCVKEIPHFIKLRSETPANELELVGISSEDENTLKAFVKKRGINYPIASAEGLPAPYNQVRGIPTTFFIDRKGIIQEVLVGYHDFGSLKNHALAADYAGEPKDAPTLEPSPAPDSAAEPKQSR